LTTYGCILCVGILAVFALYTLRLRKYQHPLSEGIISLVFCTVCGAIFSKLGYCLLLADTELFGYGIDSLFSFYPYEFSVFCGGIGVLCGIVLASRICKQASVSSLDLFAPCGALLLFVIRIGESQLGSIGAGPLLNGESWLTRIGFAFVNNYGEWHFSVYLLEAILALFCSIYFFFRSFKEKGQTFQWTLFMLALPQVFCESLRARCMKWGFVRIEQLLCGLLLLFLIWLGCKKNSSGAGKQKYLPLIISIFCVILIVFVEFALDKLPISTLMCYVLMILALVIMAVMKKKTEL